ncbi:MAG: PAS domain-containing protein [Candidatus Dormibacteraeota bacterium]|nr:PAS domain-containing protein [Candidatus Dormibacteraeota bacterium]
MNHVGRQVQLREAAFDAEKDARIVVDAEGVVSMANERARATLGVALRDVGRRLADIELSYRPVELRSLIDQATSERRVVTVTGVERSLPNGVTEVYDVVVMPLVGPEGDPMGVSITFRDVSNTTKLQTDLAKSRQELETAFEELQ